MGSLPPRPRRRSPPPARREDQHRRLSSSHYGPAVAGGREGGAFPAAATRPLRPLHHSQHGGRAGSGAAPRGVTGPGSAAGGEREGLSAPDPGPCATVTSFSSVLSAPSAPRPSAGSRRHSARMSSVPRRADGPEGETHLSSWALPGLGGSGPRWFVSRDLPLAAFPLAPLENGAAGPQPVPAEQGRRCTENLLPHFPYRISALRW
ncbi:uncharacterized protein LOC142052542 [Phalacrocorax aristotelis]|uniref:uncharacterized protein LOC142052542 n=1 Tax=Phalacrocorax aristotelis TaxID=126867 RepID=UPI003F4BA427